MHKTIPIMGRLQITTFATLVRAYETEGIRVHSKSDAIWHAVEHIAAMYTHKHGTEAFTDVREAIDYLDSVGLSLGTSTRAISQLSKIEADEAYFLETGMEVPKPFNKKQALSQSDLRILAERIAPSIKIEPATTIEAHAEQTPEQRAAQAAERDRATKEAIRQMMQGGSHTDEDTNTANCDSGASALGEHTR
jgi:hypothetical protein